MKLLPARAAAATLAATTLLGLTGCVTIDDFRRYLPEQRAQVVCERQPTIRAQDARLRELQRMQAETQSALNRGYHVHTQCRTVTSGVKEVCETQGSRQVCRAREDRQREECIETPVPLDAALESGKLAAQSQSIAVQIKERERAWQQCFAHVRTLSPEAAFNMR